MKWLLMLFLCLSALAETPATAVIEETSWNYYFSQSYGDTSYQISDGWWINGLAFHQLVVDSGAVWAERYGFRITRSIVIYMSGLDNHDYTWMDQYRDSALYLELNPYTPEYYEVPTVVYENANVTASYGENNSVRYITDSRMRLRVQNGLQGYSYTVRLFFQAQQKTDFSYGFWVSYELSPISNEKIWVSGKRLDSDGHIDLTVSSGQTIDVTPLIEGLNKDKFLFRYGASAIIVKSDH
jgi:hypothetical protein